MPRLPQTGISLGPSVGAPVRSLRLFTEPGFLLLCPLHALEPQTALTGDQGVQIVSVGPYAAERALVEQAHYAAVIANLVGKMSVFVFRSGGPAHVAVPAAAQHERRGRGQPCQ